MDTLRVSEVLIALSRACDLASSRPYGFAQRVARVADRMADQAGLPDDLRGDLLAAALLHSAGFAAVAGDVARIVIGDERLQLRLYPLDAIFDRLAAGPSLGADESSRTGVFLRHHIPIAGFPRATGLWLERAGLERAGRIVSPMLELAERRERPSPEAMASGLLSLAYHLVAVRWLAASGDAADKEMAERARDLVGDSRWLAALSGVVFEPPLLPMAEELWADTLFWQEMDAARTGAWLRIVRNPEPAQGDPDPESPSPEGPRGLASEEAVQGVDADSLMGSYTFSANELTDDVPDIDAAICALLGPRHGDRLPLDSPLFDAWLQIIGQMLDAKAVFAQGHSLRVANLVQEVALLLELNDAQVAKMRLAAWLYGVGRLALPSALVEQGRGLRAEQRSMIVETPRLTRSTLQPLRALEHTLRDASTYAERLDGSGYPRGLQSPDIPLLGRLICVVDTFEALQSDRPYRPAFSRARALHILQAQSAGLFDGVITDLVEGITRGEL